MKQIYIWIVPFFCVALSAQSIRKVNAIDAKPLLSTLNDSVSVIIDGRSPSMFASGHIADAVNIDAYTDTAKQNLEVFLEKKHIVLYCTTQNRSELLMDFLQELGFNGEIIVITDGITGWKCNNYDIVTEISE
jgi:rhodanese-related sulfurtransferase